jgi:hypothetical protein
MMLKRLSGGSGGSGGSTTSDGDGGGGGGGGDTKRQCSASPNERALLHSAVQMQRFRTRKLAQDGAKLGMTSAVAKALPFADLSAQLRDTGRIKIMKLILHRVCVVTAEGVKHYPAAGETKEINVRVFLASFMIAWHPDSVFDESSNVAETSLIAAAVAMLSIFEELCASIKGSGQGSCVKEPVAKALVFPGVLHEYLVAFEAWRAPDSLKLTDRIKHALAALLEAEDHLDESDAETPVLRASFRQQQDLLCEKLLKISSADVVKSVESLRISPAKPGDVSVLGQQAGYSAVPKRLTNEEVCHELLINPRFKIDKHGASTGENPVYSKIRQAFQVYDPPTPTQPSLPHTHTHHTTPHHTTHTQTARGT